jgi:16S rRNA G1207 methylase RsmC
MYKEPSLSKLSSRSLSKLKNKIDVAFSRQNNNENQAKNMQEVKPIRSSSTKSLAKTKYESADRNPPFSTTIKNALFQTERKF